MVLSIYYYYDNTFIGFNYVKSKWCETPLDNVLIDNLRDRAKLKNIDKVKFI